MWMICGSYNLEKDTIIADNMMLNDNLYRHLMQEYFVHQKL